MPAQISSRRNYGRVDIAAGSSQAFGHDAAANWAEVVPYAGSAWFTLIGETETLFTVQAVDDLGGGLWRATIDGVYAGPTVNDAEYAIQKDFTGEPWNLPLFAPGDVQRSQIWNRAMWIIHANLGAGGGGGGGSDGAQGLVPLASLAQPTMDLPKPRIFPKLSVQDGQEVLEWYVLQAAAPANAQDTATVDDPNARWRRVG